MAQETPSFLFKRLVSVRVGKAGGAGVNVTGLRIVANIKKTSTPESNTCELSLYNLSENTRNRFMVMNDFVYVEAGHAMAQNKDIVFAGTITSVYTKYERPDIITVIEANDGGYFLRKAKTSRSYAPKVDGTQVIKDLQKDLGLPEQKTVVGIPTELNATLEKGFAFLGKTSSAMDKVTKILGVEWSIQNNELKIVPIGQGDKSRTVRLSPETGLLKSPVRVTDLKMGNESEDDTDTENSIGVTGKKKVTAKKYKGWEFESLLVPKAEPGGIISVDSREIPKNSAFKIVSVTHTIDTHGQEFMSNIRAIAL